MEDNFDKKLKARIKRIFYNIEDPDAADGWQKLRERYPLNKKRRQVAWLWQAAAAIFIILIGVWLTYKNITPEDAVVKTVRREKQADIVHNKSPDASFNAKKNRSKQHGGSPKDRLPGLIARSANSITGNQYYSVPQKKIAALPVKDSTSNALKFGDPVKPENKQLQNGHIVNSSKVISGDLKNKIYDSLSIAGMFKADNRPGDLLKEKQKQSLKTKKVTFDVYAATFLNYAKGSSNQFNAGAGFSANLLVTGNFSFVSGLSVAQNSLSFNGQSSATAQSAFANYNAAPGSIQYGINSTTLTNSNASLVGVDIPLNFKLAFDGQRTTSFYIMAGFSSGTFINEAYTYQYNYRSSSAISTQQQQTSNKGLGSFYFAKTLNAAFGLGYPIGKNRLVVEPFLKYPLSGLGAQQLKFGAGGINLKFNFQSTKK